MVWWYFSRGHHKVIEDLTFDLCQCEFFFHSGLLKIMFITKFKVLSVFCPFHTISKYTERLNSRKEAGKVRKAERSTITLRSFILPVFVSQHWSVLIKHSDESPPGLCRCVVIQTHPLPGEAQTCSERDTTPQQIE